MLLADRGKNLKATFTADMQRYVGITCRPWSLTFLRELLKASYEHPGIWAVIVYRYGQWVYFRCRVPIIRQFCDLIYYILFNWIRTHLQIEVHRTTCIDGGFRISHFSGIIINSQLIAGKNLTVTSGVIIGQTDNGVPVLGDDVDIGVGAKIIGGIHLGNRIIIGAQSLVNKDFPDDVIIAGVPAKIIRNRTNVNYSDEFRSQSDVNGC